MAGTKAFIPKSTFQLRPDSKGRLGLGKLANGVSSYLVHEEENGRLILEPMVEIPAREKWLFENKAALKSVQKGLKESVEGKVKSLGSFAQFADEDDE